MNIKTILYKISGNPKSAMYIITLFYPITPFSNSMFMITSIIIPVDIIVYIISCVNVKRP